MVYVKETTGVGSVFILGGLRYDIDASGYLDYRWVKNIHGLN